MSEKAVARVLKVPHEKLLQMEDFPRIVRFICNRLTKVTGFWLGLQRQATRKDLRKAAAEELEKIDFTLALMARELSTLCRIRAKESNSADLVCDVITATLGGFDELPAVWRQYERLSGADWGDPYDACTWGYHLPAALSVGINFFLKLCEEHPEHFRLWASEKPYLPMLVFRNVSAYRDRFSRLADSLNLGANCPINVSERAMFRFTDSPINALVFDVLMVFMEAFEWIDWAHKTDPVKQIGKGATFEDLLIEYARMPREEHGLFMSVRKLKPLTKTSSREWAEKAVIPYLETRYSDWRKVPALASHLGKAGGRAKAKEAILDALRGMAKPEPSETCLSSR